MDLRAPDISVLASARARAWFQHDGTTRELLGRMARSLADSARTAALSVELIFHDAGGNHGPAQWLSCHCDGLAKVTVLVDEHNRLPNSRGRGINSAAAVAGARVLAILQPDMLIVADVLTRGLAVARRGEAFLPYYMRYSGPAEAAWRLGNGTGNVFVLRETFQRVGGWPDVPWTDGKDDTAFAHRLKSAGVPLIRELPGGLAHMWHPSRMGWDSLDVEESGA